MKIMIVEDCIEEQKLISHFLKNEGYADLITFSSAMRAYDFLEDCINSTEEDLLPNLILIDIVMQGMGGIELCQIIKNRTFLRHIPVLMITSTNELTLLDKAYRVGANDFITKPIKPIELIARVKQSIELHKEKTSKRKLEERLFQIVNEMQGDLQLAKQVQKSMLGKPFSNKEIEINAKYIPSADLSGDLYYWLQISEHQYGVIIYDVRGQGMPGALISMSIRSLLYGLFTRVIDPEKVMKELNRHMYRLYMSDQPDKFHSSYFTAIYMVIDTKAKTLDFINAGHPAGLYFTDPNSCIPLSISCPPIGLLPELELEKTKLSYEGPATIILYSDGLTDLPDNREIEGVSLLKETVKTTGVTDENLLDSIISSRLSTASVTDDICLVSIKL